MLLLGRPLFDFKLTAHTNQLKQQQWLQVSISYVIVERGQLNGC